MIIFRNLSHMSLTEYGWLVLINVNTGEVRSSGRPVTQADRCQVSVIRARKHPPEAASHGPAELRARPFLHFFRPDLCCKGRGGGQSTSTFPFMFHHHVAPADFDKVSWQSVRPKYSSLSRVKAFAPAFRRPRKSAYGLGSASEVQACH